MIDFSEFWSRYPRKVGRMLAERKWSRMTDADRKQAIDSLKLWCRTDQWQETRFIPHGSTFLNREQWRDEPEVLPERKQAAPEKISDHLFGVYKRIVARERKQKDDPSIQLPWEN